MLLQPKIALIWHNSSESLSLCETYNWHLIDSKEKFEVYDFQTFDQIIILAELSWKGFYENQLHGLKLAYSLKQETQNLENRIFIISKKGINVLKEGKFNMYHQTLTASKIMLDYGQFFQKVNALGISVFDFQEQIINQGFETLYRMLIEPDKHDKSLLDLIHWSKAELTTLACIRPERIQFNNLKDSIKRLKPALISVRLAYEKVIPLVNFNRAYLPNHFQRAVIKRTGKISDIIKLLNGRNRDLSPNKKK